MINNIVILDSKYPKTHFKFIPKTFVLVFATKYIYVQCYLKTSKYLLSDSSIILNYIKIYQIVVI